MFLKKPNNKVGSSEEDPTPQPQYHISKFSFHEEFGAVNSKTLKYMMLLLLWMTVSCLFLVSLLRFTDPYLQAIRVEVHVVLQIVLAIYPFKCALQKTKEDSYKYEAWFPTSWTKVAMLIIPIILLLLVIRATVSDNDFQRKVAYSVFKLTYNIWITFVICYAYGQSFEIRKSWTSKGLIINIWFIQISNAILNVVETFTGTISMVIRR